MSRKNARRLLVLIVAAGAFTPMPGEAGDYAERSLLGFSPDGRYFAFEEYGIQDGSGFPYSNIFLIDIVADEWVEGTPIRVLIEGENPPLSETRSESTDRFRPFLTRYQIGTQGQTVASNPLTETSANPHLVSFLPRPLSPPLDRDHDLALQEYELPAPNCPDMGQPYKGFQLTIVGPDNQQRVLSRDERIPGSRNCPLAYAISEVVTYHPPQGKPVLAVMISILSVGFEGPDRRFIAVTGHL
jgi:predicted secreted protein